MAIETHAVVRTDLMAGTDVRAKMVSVMYLGDDGETATAIDNGNVIKIGVLMDGEREIHVGTTPSESDDITDIGLVATPELWYDERIKNIDKFYNIPDKPVRVYRLMHGDIFSVTELAFDGTPEVGQTVTLGDSTKLVVGGSGTTIGTIIEVETPDHYTYYAIQVA